MPIRAVHLRSSIRLRLHHRRLPWHRRQPGKPMCSPQVPSRLSRHLQMRPNRLRLSSRPHRLNRHCHNPNRRSPHRRNL